MTLQKRNTKKPEIVKTEVQKQKPKSIADMTDSERIQAYQRELNELSQKYGFGIEIRATNPAIGDLSDSKGVITFDKIPTVVPLERWNPPVIPDEYETEETPEDDNHNSGGEKPSP